MKSEMPREISAFRSLAAGVQAELEGLGGVSNLLVLAGFAIGLVGSMNGPGVGEASRPMEMA